MVRLFQFLTYYHLAAYSGPLLRNLRPSFLLYFWDVSSSMWWNQLPRHDLYVSQLFFSLLSKRKKKRNEVKTTASRAQRLSVWRHTSGGGCSLLHWRLSRADSPQLLTEFILTEPEIECKNVRKLQRINHHCSTFCLDRIVSESQGWRNTSRLNTRPRQNRSVLGTRVNVLEWSSRVLTPS